MNSPTPNRVYYILLTALGVALLPLPSMRAQSPPTSLASDSALVQHLRRTDQFFALLVNCKDGKLVRTQVPAVHHGEKAVEQHFSYGALCEVRGEEGDDCLYRVDLAGTIDGPESATIRRLRWELVCGG